MQGGTSCNVRVVARFRPPPRRDADAVAAAAGAKHVVAVAADMEIRPEAATVGLSKSNYVFDSVFDPSIDQARVFDVVGRPAVDDVLKGYNSTIFAYGQTGSGKTFTMYGPESTNLDADSKGPTRGIVPRATTYLFSRIAAAAEGGGDNAEGGAARAGAGASGGGDDAAGDDEGLACVEYVIKCSCVEIYNETVRDLLNPRAKDPVRIRETDRRGVWMEGATALFASCEEDVFRIVREGYRARSTSKTDMNDRSSRSHCVFILTLQQIMSDGSSKTSQLNLVDLAGSERVNRSGATGVALQEARSINQSLSALGNCIHALTESNRAHIPYRDSRLTHLLKESIGGNTKTVLIITGTTLESDREETLSTLRFGVRAKTIKNKVHINKELSMEELKLKLETIMKYVQVLEKENKALKRRLGNGSASATPTPATKSGSSRHLARRSTGGSTKSLPGTPTTTAPPSMTAGSGTAARATTSGSTDGGPPTPSGSASAATTAPSTTGAASTDYTLQQLMELQVNFEKSRAVAAELDADLHAERSMRKAAEADAAELRLALATVHAESAADASGKLQELQGKLARSVRAASEADLAAAREAARSRRLARQVNSLEAELRVARRAAPPATSTSSPPDAAGGDGSTLPRAGSFVVPDTPAIPRKLSSLRQLSGHLRERRLALEAARKQASSAAAARPPGDSDVGTAALEPSPVPAPVADDVTSPPTARSDASSTALEDAVARQAERIEWLEQQLRQSWAAQRAVTPLLTPAGGATAGRNAFIVDGTPRHVGAIVKHVKVTPRRGGGAGVDT